MDLSVDIGLERIQRAIALLMAQNINTEIAVQQSLWDARDASWFSAMGRASPNYTIEPIIPDNIHSGTIPSLIQSPASEFPNLSVIAYSAVPQGANDDWMERYVCTVTLEFLVKSLTDEDLVNARIQRTLEAGHSVLTSDYARRIPEADGTILVPQISSMPVATISDVFVRHTSASPTDRSFYQHGTLTYRIDKYSSYPS